jgi:WD40 repeat protein
MKNTYCGHIFKSIALFFLFVVPLLVSAQTNALVTTFSETGYEIKALAGSHNQGELLVGASNGFNGSVKLRAVPSGQVLRTFSNTAPSSAVTYDQTGVYVVAGTEEGGRMLIWNRQSGQLLASLPSDVAPVSAIAYNQQRQLIAISGRNDVRIYNVNGSFVSSFYSVFNLALAYNKTGKYLAAGGGSGVVYIYDLDTNTIVNTLQIGGWVQSIAFSPDDQSIVVGATNGGLTIWDYKNGVFRESLVGHIGTVRSVLYSPSGKYVFSAGDDKEIMIWELSRAEKAVASFQGHEGSILALTLMSNGHYLASGASDGVIKIWDLNTLNLPLTQVSEETSINLMQHYYDKNSKTMKWFFTSEANFNGQMIIYNTLGQEVYRFEMLQILVGGNEFATPIPQLALGLYHYRITNLQKYNSLAITGSFVVK